MQTSDPSFASPNHKAATVNAMPETASDVTDNAILNGRLRLLQPRRGHRFGHDAILLAAAVPARPHQRVAEFGAGVGAASLALLSRVNDTDATLIEIDAHLCTLARENIARNGFSDRARAVALNITATSLSAAGIEAGFDHVFMNPPFNNTTLQPSPHSARRTAHAGDIELLRNWVKRADEILCDSGTVTVIWRADGLADVLDVLRPGFGAITLIPIYPAPDRPAIRIIVTGRKDDRTPMRVLPPLTLNDRQQRPTDEAESILRRGGSWPPNA